MGDSATRHAVDVVVPFAGSPASLTDLAARLGRLERGPADTLTVVDNRPVAAPQGASGDVRIIRASELRSSYYARNQGAAAGRNPWLVFLDADVEPPTDLIARYFAGAPGERTAVLAGGVVDEPLDRSAAPSAAARYAMLHAAMSQSNTMLEGPWAYAQTANCAVRRDAFEAVGGFRDSVRSGGDADLCFRLRAEGWAIDPCERASVVHRSRRTMRELLRQRARHGAGAAWLERQYPGAYPPARRLGLAKWTAQSFAAAAFARVRGRRDDALVAAIKPLWVWAFELGRLFPNEVAER